MIWGAERVGHIKSCPTFQLPKLYFWQTVCPAIFPTVIPLSVKNNNHFRMIIF
jgi:hypothetical protein